jgi:hypothetical protein
VDLAVPGWKPDQKTTGRDFNDCSSDTVMIGPPSNIAFGGTGEDGAPVPVYKDSVGIYH